MNSLVYASPARSSSQSGDKYGGQYEAPVGPPSYEATTRDAREKERGVVRRWVEKMRARKEEKRTESVPKYVP